MKMNLVYGQIHRNPLIPKIKQKIRAYLRINFIIFKRELDERLVQNLPVNELTAPYHGVQEYKPPTVASIRVQSDLVKRNINKSELLKATSSFSASM
jgi:hypothetical protein